jgi:chromosome segregation ATPase
MELLVQLCLTACATVSYSLCNCVLPLKIGLHTDLGNSRTEKASFKQELVELRSQLETERADQKEIEAELCELKQNSAPVARLFKKLTLRLVIILSPLRAREKN